MEKHAKAYTVRQLAKMAGVSVRTLHHYDHIGLLRPSARTAAGYRLYGTKDVQAPALENLAAARLLIDRLGRSDWVVRELGEMNHAFQRCQTGMPDEYACIDHVMGHEVVGEVAAWIASTTHGSRCNSASGLDALHQTAAGSTLRGPW